MKIPEHLRGLYRAAREQGWVVERLRSGHLKWSPPTGRATFSSSTPSDRTRDFQNVRSKLRRHGLKV